MKPRGYYWCDQCDDGAAGRKCEHCGHEARFVHVALTQTRAPQVTASGRRVPVSDDFAAAQFVRMHERLNGKLSV